MRDKDTPLALVRLWPKMNPDCYEKLDLCRSLKDRGEMNWPDYCRLPINAAYTYLVSCVGFSDQDAALVCAELTACWIWRQNKIIYTFDADLAESLAAQAYDMQDTDVLPAELLMHLPYPCIYIKAPGLLEHTDGFWAWMDFDTNREGPELRIQWVFDGMDASFAQVLHIIPGGTISDCFLDTIQTTLEHFSEPVDVSKPADSCRTILTAIQLLLYILSDNADVEDAPPDISVAKSRKQSSIRHIVQDKASEVQAKNVGIRIGAAFRRSKQGQSSGNSIGTGSTKRPHMRRGHWHHYWAGPKDGDRKLVLRWTAPTMIHSEIGVGDNVTVYPVKKD